MSKKQQKRQWEHTPAEILQQLVSLSQMKGRVISRRAVRKDPFLDYEEVIALLGKDGGWPAVEAKIREQLGLLEPKKEITEEPVEDAVSGPEEENVFVVESVSVPEPEPVSEVVPIERKKKTYTKDELVGILRQMQEYLGRMPKVADFAKLKSEGWEIPTYATFVRHLGEKSGWEELLAA